MIIDVIDTDISSGDLNRYPGRIADVDLLSGDIDVIMIEGDMRTHI